MTNPGPSTTTPSPPSVQDQRHELQGLLGEFHGLLTTIIQRLVALAGDQEMAELLNDLNNAFPGVSVSFGEVQGELNTGDHDADLPGVALAAEQVEPKKRGLRFNISRFHSALTGPSKKENFVRAARYAIRGVNWGNIIVGSLAKELGKFRGAEVIREFGEAVVATLEQLVERKETGASGEAR